MKILPNEFTRDVAGKGGSKDKNDTRRIEPEFYIISVYGQTYLVAANTRKEAAVVLAETRCLATDPADWTTMQDGMFAEITPTHQLRGRVLNRDQYLELCRHQNGYVDVVELCAQA